MAFEEMLNLKNRCKLISEALNSNAVVDYLGQGQIDKMTLLKMVIESKIGFDTLSSDPENARYFNEIEESIVYSTEHYSALVLLITASGDPKQNFQNSHVLNQFYLFHKMIMRTTNLITNLMSKMDVLESSTEGKLQADVFDIKGQPQYDESYNLLKKLSGF